jgi:hypothetical protein
MGYEAGRDALSPGAEGLAAPMLAETVGFLPPVIRPPDQPPPTREENGAREVLDVRGSIRQAAAQYGVPEVWIGCIVMHESQGIERLALGDTGERAQAFIQGDTASIGIGQMQVGVAERLRRTDPRLRGQGTTAVDDLLNADRSVFYIAAYLAEIRRNMNLWLTRMGEALEPTLERDMVLLGYNIGWPALRDRNLSDPNFGKTYHDRAVTIRQRSHYIALATARIDLVQNALLGVDPIRRPGAWA